MSIKPLVSIIVPKLSGSVKHSLDTILDENYPKLEVIVYQSADFPTLDLQLLIDRNVVVRTVDVAGKSECEAFTAAAELAGGQFVQYLQDGIQYNRGFVRKAVLELLTFTEASLASGSPIEESSATGVHSAFSKLDSRYVAPVIRFMITMYAASPRAHESAGIIRTEFLKSLLPIKNIPQWKEYLVLALCCRGGFLEIEGENVLLKDNGTRDNRRVLTRDLIDEQVKIAKHTFGRNKWWPLMAAALCNRLELNPDSP